MGQSWEQCQRMLQHERHRCDQLRSHATGAPVNVQPVQAYLSAQAGATNPDPAIDQVLQKLSALQRKYMLHIDPSELNSFVRVPLKLGFKMKGRAKLLALVKELRQYNDSIERRLAIPVGHPVPRMF